MGWQLNRAADVAEARIRYLSRIKTKAQQDAENEMCANGIEGCIHWFKYYAWGYDPRPDSPLQVMPFVLFNIQERYIRWVHHLVFQKRSGGLVEKSRDMGATDGFLKWDTWAWRYVSGFSGMLCSATEELVDSKSDPDTLFEKTRFNIRLLPTWMYPKAFDPDKDMPYMNIANHEQGSIISGMAPTRRAGRQRRRTIVLGDEFQSWPYGGYPQATAISQTTRSFIKLGTPEGRLNKYAEERFSGKANLFEMDWRTHPWKDDRWYNALPYGFGGPAMTTTDIAQEIDRNYDASQPGNVYGEYNELYHVITWPEFAKVIGDDAINSVTQEYRIPRHWYIGCGLDWGATDESQHPAVLIWIAVAGENAPKDLRGSVFVYREMVWGDSPTVGDVAEYVKMIEKPEKESEREGIQRRISHERKTERATFQREHGMLWQKWDTVDNFGISVVKEYLRPKLLENEPHPFRPGLKGRPKLFLLVDENQGALQVSETGTVSCTAATDHRGLKRLRAEFPTYHFPASEAGKPAGQMKPYKLFDDAMDALRGIAGHFFVSAVDLTDAEKQEKALPVHAKIETIAKVEDADTRSQLLLARRAAVQKYEEEKKRKDYGGGWRKI